MSRSHSADINKDSRPKRVLVELMCQFSSRYLWRIAGSVVICVVAWYLFSSIGMEAERGAERWAAALLTVLEAFDSC